MIDQFIPSGLSGSCFDDLLVTPEEAAERIVASGGSTVHMCHFAMDFLHWYHKKIPVLPSDDMGKVMFAAAALLEAGRMIGLKQARQRKRKS